MSRARRTVKRWGYLAAITVLALGIVVEGVLLIPVIQQQAQYAEDGKMARARQIRVMPVSCKEHLDAYRRGVITAEDLKLVRCPIKR